jgi:hypothetical protein
LYVILLPFLIGAMAVAEEKAWGVAHWHLTLPPSARKQWCVKAATALTLTLALGFGLPALMLWVSQPLLGFRAQQQEELWMISATILLAQLLATSVSLYAGGFSSSTLRAILLAVGLAFGAGCAINLLIALSSSATAVVGGSVCLLFALIQQGLNHFTSAGFEGGRYLMANCGLLVLVPLVLGFAFVNFKTNEVRLWRSARQYALLFLVAFMFSCAVGILPAR